MRDLALLTLSLLLWTCSGCTPMSTIDGLVLSENGVVQNPEVLAYKDFKSLAHNSGAISSTPGEKPGQFTMRLEPGSYYFTATSNDGKEPLFSYHGLNPLTITEEDRWLPFFAVPEEPAICQTGFQGIGGHIYFKGVPTANGGVSVYTIDDMPFRGMGLLTNTITSDGSFWFDLEPGQYVLVARKRMNHSGIGPLSTGDLFCYTSANPIEVRPGQECQVDMFCYPRDDIGGFLSSNAPDPRGRRETTRRALSSKEAAAETPPSRPRAIPKMAASLSGKVTDTDSKPRAGLFVTAFPADDLNLFQMYIIRFKTPFMTKTDLNGNYHIDVESGSYYLVAREQIGVAPEHLEYFGLYEGTANHSIIVRPGESRDDGDILVGRIMP